MKILCVAHPDDECLWFNPKGFDKIIMCFMDRADNFKVFLGRRKALGKHPLKDKIVTLNLTESNYQTFKSKREAHVKNYEELVKILKEKLKDADEVWTHNSWGEYQHADHIMVHEAVREATDKPIFVLDGIVGATGKERIEVDMDLDLYKEIKEIYKTTGSWTWRLEYDPPAKQYYYKVN